MEIRVLGDTRDVTGFALAGVAGIECRTREEVEQALARLTRDPAVAILLISRQSAALAPEAVERARNSVAFPVAIVLPEADDDGKRPAA